MRCGNEKFQKDYYNKLLANYNPSQKYTSAAKQVINRIHLRLMSQCFDLQHNCIDFDM